MRSAAAWARTAEGLRLSTRDEGRHEYEAGARRYALAVGRALELALTAAHAQWAHDVEGGRLSMAAARRLAMSTPDLELYDVAEARRLALDHERPPS